MKIITNDGIYVQKKDLDLILKSTDNKKIPTSIVEKYKVSDSNKDDNFIFFKEADEFNFLNNVWFIVDYNDFIDLNFGEFTDFYLEDLDALRKMRVEHDKNKFLSESKVYNNRFEMWIDEMNYFNYVPTKAEIKKYPLDMQLLYNKVSDILDIRGLQGGNSKLEVPEGVYKPIHYSRKQLQQIYYEVLSEELSFEELKPYQQQLYSIFSRIDYTPDILEIIRKIILLNRNNVVDFIDDDLLDFILRFHGKGGKLEESTRSLIDELYTIGYKRPENFDSRIMLENDIKIIKDTINYFAGFNNFNDKDFEKLSMYNPGFAEIIKVAKQCNYKPYKSRIVRDIFSNILAYVYLNPGVINNDYSFLADVHDFVANNTTIALKLTQYDVKNADNYHKHFVDNFNRANSLLVYLYNQKNKKDKLDKKPSLADNLQPNDFEPQ